ncbi:hypothetical protein NQ317_015142 [Molorchus minor]|uniref:Uncharacterized protein n=1 Tax=Molorchus minor TaxID=1323400 RepID=A0ABQ9K6K3_9CUCU|nr:hypothetical protein NQ317_015142 [Molorchus minor]
MQCKPMNNGVEGLANRLSFNLLAPPTLRLERMASVLNILGQLCCNRLLLSLNCVKHLRKLANICKE